MDMNHLIIIISKKMRNWLQFQKYQGAGDDKIEDIYADTDLKEIIVKGNKTNPIESLKPLYNHYTKFGKFNLHIPY